MNCFKKMNKIFIIVLFFVYGCLDNTSDLTMQTLTHDNVVREYYVSYPENIDGPVPLIINMHGFASHAIDQKDYSKMDSYAHSRGVAVVYPEGISRSWNVGTEGSLTNEDDVGFISTLIDSIATDFDIDLDRIYACGMSNGGYMSYELICNLSDKITAFGSVTGNFMLNDNQSCAVNREIPLIHIHGTKDRLVDYENSRDDAMNTMDSINYWVKHNKLTQVELEVIDDLDPSDGTNVEKFTFYSENSDTKVVHFKIYNGGHQWFGSPIADWFLIKLFLGKNNHEINSNKELVDFFLQYKLSDFN